MNESRWERYGAAAGITFVIMLVLAAFVAPQPPHIEDSTAKIAAYFTDHTRALLASGMFAGLAGLALMWFVGHLRHVLQRAEGGAEALSPITFASGVVLAASIPVVALPPTTLAYMAQRGDAATADTVRLVYDMGNVMNMFIALTMALFVASASLAMVRKEMLAPWLGWAGLAIATVGTIGACAGFFATELTTALSVMTFGALLAFGAWMLVASVSMLQRPEVERLHASVPVFGH